MAKVSKVYKYEGMSFRYNYDKHVVEYVEKLSKKELAEVKKDNEEWQVKYGKDLWTVDESGYMVIDSQGLREENWNSEDRDYYLDCYCEEIRCTCAL